MENIDIFQAKQFLPELIEKTADKGETIILTKNGVPIAKLIAFKKPIKKRKFGSAKGLIKISDDFDKPLEDFKEHM